MVHHQFPEAPETSSLLGFHQFQPAGQQADPHRFFQNQGTDGGTPARK